MGSRTRRWAVALVLGFLIAALLFVLARRTDVDSGDRAGAGPAGQVGGWPTRGGELVAAIRNDPPTFNRYAPAGGENTVEVITHLLHAKLARVDRVTGVLEPWLAARWIGTPDQLTWTLTLRDGIRWSDGAPFTSADVVFSFQAVYDDRVNSSMRTSMLVHGKPIEVSATDSRTVVLRFPAPFGPGLRMLDNLVIYPRHKLEPRLRAGTLGEAWGPSVAPADLVGMGPFRLVSYVPAERMVFERNEHYWRQDDGGTRLPYLDRLTLTIVRDQNTEVLRIQNGQIDISAREIRPEDYAPLRREQERGRVRLTDAGVGLDPNMLWFNLSPALAGDARRSWLQSEDFRKAISHAVDRQALVDQVYLGAGVPLYGPVTPGNREWYVEDLPRFEHDPARARALLTGPLGMADRNGDGVLEDRSGRPVRFSIVSQQQDTIRMRAVSVIQEHLRKVGVAVDIVGLDAGSIIQRWTTGNYDAIYFGVEASSHDPANNLDFWLSSGGFHVWDPGQKTPATPWERRIDALMHEQASATDPAERRRLYAEAQRIFAEHVPILYFAAPRIVIAMTPRVANARPVPLKPIVLWSADSLAVSGSR